MSPKFKPIRPQIHLFFTKRLSRESAVRPSVQIRVQCIKPKNIIKMLYTKGDAKEAEKRSRHNHHNQQNQPWIRDNASGTTY